MSTFEPVIRHSLSDEIITQLTDLISMGKLKPGQRLASERDLSKQFGVGRSSLREALRSLVVMGILEGRIGEGTYVAKDSQKYLARTAQWGLDLVDDSTHRIGFSCGHSHDILVGLLLAHAIKVRVSALAG